MTLSDKQQPSPVINVTRPLQAGKKTAFLTALQDQLAGRTEVGDGELHRTLTATAAATFPAAGRCRNHATCPPVAVNPVPEHAGFERHSLKPRAADNPRIAGDHWKKETGWSSLAPRPASSCRRRLGRCAGNCSNRSIVRR